METTLREALRKFLRTSRLGASVKSVQIQEVWADVMGQAIARATDRIEVVNRTLFITTTVAPLRQELHFSRALIISRVNEAIGEALIEEVVVR
jgi:hypothetical protein